MPRRVVLLGATGYTGRLTAAALAGRAVPLVLAGRDAGRLAAVREVVAPTADVAVVDLATTADGLLRDALPGGPMGRDDVLVSTVGPFLRLGLPVARRAVENGWSYVDSTGEPPFVRRLVEDLGTLAGATGARLLPAFGYDYVPGHLAAALALEEAGADALAVRVGYFLRGRAAASSGTLASAGGVLAQRGYAWRHGRLVNEAPGRHVHAYDAGGRRREGFSIAGSEHLFLPRSFPRLLDVSVHLGWAGGWSRVAGPAAAAVASAARVPGIGPMLDAGLGRVLRSSGTGPSAEDRAASGSLCVAEALDARGTVRARVELEGPDPYALTADLLAEAAVALRDGQVAATGVLGPLEALGTEHLTALCARAGLVRSD